MSAKSRLLSYESCGHDRISKLAKLKCKLVLAYRDLKLLYKSSTFTFPTKLGKIYEELERCRD